MCVLQDAGRREHVGEAHRGMEGTGLLATLGVHWSQRSTLESRRGRYLGATATTQSNYDKLRERWTDGHADHDGLVCVCTLF
jgi:hypothetical protein